jgi:hypothetical protein
VSRYDSTTHVQTSEKRPVCIIFYLIGYSAGDVRRAYRRRVAEAIRADGAEKIREEREGTTSGLAGVPLTVATLALHLDDLELHAIRTLKEADPPTIARGHLL